ncbi:MAG: HEAT repeat domain-containing protein, partial [Myxococcota bacterium]|nr:HEAT repeat domain-containing protein [Myxococcota bacterium]
MLAESRFVDDRDMSFHADKLLDSLIDEVTFTPMVDPSAMVANNIDTIASVARAKLSGDSSEVKALALEDLTRPELLLGLGVSQSPETVDTALRGVLKTLHPELLAAVRSESEEDPRIVRASLVLLGLLGDKNDLELLLQKAADKDPTIRRAAIHGLSLGHASKDRAHATMVKGLSDEDFSVRAACASALGGIGKGSANKSVTDALVARLMDDYISVRVEAARSLGRLEATAAVPKLISALEASSRDVQRAALAALARIDDPTARAEVARFKNHSDWRLREAASGKMN